MGKAPTLSCGGSGESKSRKGRNDDVECRAMAVLGIGKRPDQCEEFKNRPRPSVNQQERYCVGAR